MGKKKSDRDGGVEKIRKKVALVEDDHIGTKMNHVEEKLGSFALLGDDEHVHEDVSYNGKKFNSVFSVLDDDDDEEGDINEKDGVVIDPNLEELKEEEEEEENPSIVKFSGKKKPSKKKNVNDLSKNKKNKGQEEDDLDKILAQLGEISSEPPQEEEDKSEAIVLDNKAGVVDDVIVESAAAKKKKKKKEKEKEKKAMAAREEKPVEPNTIKLADKNKKIPKHVREMQERLARQKEAEEKMKREDEEKRRKEEEERLRQEEAERVAQEKKQLKKERAKQRRIKKREEGKPLTAKQKAEAERLEAMRNQFLSSTRNPTVTQEQMSSNQPLKKPKYITRKSSKPRSSNQDDDIDANKVDDDDHVDMENVVAENKEVSEVEENGSNSEEYDDDEEWDAKSWDDADLRLPGLSAFGDEEEEVIEREPESVAQKVIKKEIQQERQQEGETVMVKDDKNIAEEVIGGEEKTLRSPICCIMGHVDTGKTKLLDCIRRTNVQEGEAGGITQQIGATYIPAHNIRERTKELKADAKLNVPGLLVIDTPGHEAFKNLRSRGSGLCDIAILVVDIMHGLEPQTIESLHLLRMRNTEFIVALNKVDRLYGWKTCRNAPIGKALKLQNKDVQLEFHHRVTQIITQFKEQGLNTEVYNKNKDMGETYSIVPTSAISGEGIPEMLLLLVQWAQKTMVEKLTYMNDIQCTVLEVEVVEGLGTTIDVVLVNGVLHEGDEIVVCGFQGPIHTTIRSLLTPHPMKELRVKGAYIHHKEIKAAQGIKITAQNLEHAVAGTALYLVRPSDDLDDIKESVMADMRNVMNRIDKSGEGVYVQASTLGSLEALLEFLKTPTVNIPVSGIGIGPVHKKDVVKASAMLGKKKEFATILAFDVKVTPEAREIADSLDMKIFTADIIYHLFDQFKAYIDNIKEVKKKEAAEDAVFPCVLQIMPHCVFNKKDPIILGVNVLEGILKIGTPICIPQRDFINIGRISSIEKNKQQFDSAKKGEQVAIKLIGSNPEEKQKMFGRHFEIEDELVSHISRESINILKTNYRDELSNEDWKLVVKLKHVFKIQ